MHNFKFFAFLLCAGTLISAVESQAYSEEISGYREGNSGYVEKSGGAYTELGVPVKRAGNGVPAEKVAKTKVEEPKKEPENNVPVENSVNEVEPQENPVPAEAIAPAESVPASEPAIVGDVRISRDDPVFAEEVRAVMKSVLDKENAQPIDGWYFSITGQYNLAQTEICGSEKMNTFGATFVLGKELKDSHWDFALMVSVLAGEKVDYESGWYWNDNYSKTKVENHYDFLAGVRAGLYFVPADWLTLKIGAMGGLDALYMKASHRDSSYYYWWRDDSDVDKFGFGFFVGAYASAQFNLSKHFSLALETSYLHTSNDLHSDVNLEKDLNYLTAGASLIFRW